MKEETGKKSNIVLRGLMACLKNENFMGFVIAILLLAIVFGVVSLIVTGVSNYFKNKDVASMEEYSEMFKIAELDIRESCIWVNGYTESGQEERYQVKRTEEISEKLFYFDECFVDKGDFVKIEGEIYRWNGDKEGKVMIFYPDDESKSLKAEILYSNTAMVDKEEK